MVRRIVRGMRLYSAVDINEHGWVAEIFIPYSEVRFPEGDIQVWGLNMEREFRRARTAVQLESC